MKRYCFLFLAIVSMIGWGWTVEAEERVSLFNGSELGQEIIEIRDWSWKTCEEQAAEDMNGQLLEQALAWVAGHRFYEAATVGDLLLKRSETASAVEIAEKILEEEATQKRSRGIGETLLTKVVSYGLSRGLSFDPTFEGPLSPNHGRSLATALVRLAESRRYEDFFLKTLARVKTSIFIYTDGWDCPVVEVSLPSPARLSPRCRQTVTARAWQEWEKVQEEISSSEDLSQFLYNPCDGLKGEQTPAARLRAFLGSAIELPPPPN